MKIKVLGGRIGNGIVDVKRAVYAPDGGPSFCKDGIHYREKTGGWWGQGLIVRL